MGICSGKEKKPPKHQARGGDFVGKQRSLSFDSDNPPAEGVGLACHGCRTPLGKTRVRFEGKELCHNCYQLAARRQPLPMEQHQQQQHYDEDPYRRQYEPERRHHHHHHHHRPSNHYDDRQHYQHDQHHRPERHNNHYNNVPKPNRGGRGYYDYTRTSKNDQEYDQ
eukprot:TRINITY_DN2944_c0_g1_i1.p1 TRINITY_DN2944_c0_g1~~TRINITY_DN2944_c0_g1_i1.p1  ORF type:complete len:166 (+),score=27.79 TRINITY_DN2944_c0_g1_i1:77-574(+)